MHQDKRFWGQLSIQTHALDDLGNINFKNDFIQNVYFADDFAKMAG